MRIEDKLSPTQPALVITYGNTTRKIRPLDRDVILLGQAPGCDLQLKSPDISPVHLLILRTPDGWRLRDCSGRGSARLNGKLISDDLLRHTDVIQLSTFSFYLHLPSSRPTAPPTPESPMGQRDTVLDRDPPAAPLGDANIQAPAPSAVGHYIQRLERSRKNLAGLALKLRQRYHTTMAAFVQLQQQVAHQESSQEAQQREVDGLLQDLKGRVRQLEQKEVELRSGRTALEQEGVEWRAKQAEMEKKLTQRQEEIEARWQLCLREHLAGTLSGADEETLRRWRIRSVELQHYVCHLRRQANPAASEQVKQILEELRQQLDQQAAEMQRLRDELEKAHNDGEDRASYEADLNRFRLDLERDRNELNDQLALLQMMAQENERMIQERNKVLVREQSELAGQREQLRQDAERLRKEREKFQQEQSRPKQPGSQSQQETVYDEEDDPPAPVQAACPRDASLRDRLTHAHKIKKEMAERRYTMIQQAAAKRKNAEGS
jgi:pSer/pThr/pTyr-binding forkhead associated (FHA) protein